MILEVLATKVLYRGPGRYTRQPKIFGLGANRIFRPMVSLR